VKTNDRGGYSIQTIKPGSYPRGRNPAHIHAILKLPNKSPVWIEDFLFEGDPFLTDQQRQGSTKKTSFGNIITLTRNGAGILTGVRDILIDE
jgi:protocatechuate 3,4-dioxygenase beta subunit